MVSQLDYFKKFPLLYGNIPLFLEPTLCQFPLRGLNTTSKQSTFLLPYIFLLKIAIVTQASSLRTTGRMPMLLFSFVLCADAVSMTVSPEK
jgi:hypothetical protein